ncbi:MAG TPA: phosphate ABC transporter substrate-binding/OmpA family protein [Thermoanaerobaculia bacterium]|nr:phosphate ABC transporter substrate-binding/OmpA family protein [Thermoanaerobaculia bacterium]
MPVRRNLAVFITLIALAAWLGSPAPSPAAAATLQVKGSDTIGGKLGQDFARDFSARHPEVEVKWEALGSGTAFVGLLDGSAQLGASSRGVKENELAEARKLGVELREFVIGYDGIAVIVHPGNPVAELTIAQLSDLFTGKIHNWREVGGPDLAVHLVSRPSYSGTFSFFRDKVLRRGNDKGPEDYAASAEFIEENGTILDKVAREPGAISYVGIGWVTPAVKTLGVAAKPGQPAVKASVATVRTGTYPIYRPLLMYSRGEPHGPAREMLAFILSGEGQKIVAKNDFVPGDSPVALPPEGPAAAAAHGAGLAAGTGAGNAAAGGASASSNPPRVVRVQFPKGSTLTAAAKETLAGVAENAKTGGYRLLVVGHADVRGSKAVNARMALARAKAVAAYLADLGVPDSAIQVSGRGADEPVGTNESSAGRGANRRVDITLLAPGRVGG